MSVCMKYSSVDPITLCKNQKISDYQKTAKKNELTNLLDGVIYLETYNSVVDIFSCLHFAMTSELKVNFESTMCNHIRIFQRYLRKTKSINE